jgi:hypothetical protein
VFFRLLDPLPVRPDLIDVLHLHIAEDVRMAANQLVRNVSRDLFEVERPAFEGELTMKNHLQQQIAQFLLNFMVVARFDGIHELIDFLDRVVTQRHVVLLAVPRATGG